MSDSAPSLDFVLEEQTRNQPWAQGLLICSIDLSHRSRKVILDLSSVCFLDPFALIRIRGFLDWWVSQGCHVEVKSPLNTHTANYLARMHIVEGIQKEAISFALPVVHERDRRKVLVELQCLSGQEELTPLSDRLYTVVREQLEGKLAASIDTFENALGELGDNALNHGRSERGIYVAAQSYSDGRCVLAIGDTGIGVPAHLRNADLGIEGADERVLQKALELGVTGTGNPRRGLGFYSVLEAAQQAQLAAVSLRIWSGRGRVEIRIENGKQVVDRSYAAPETVGTWIRLEFETD